MSLRARLRGWLRGVPGPPPRRGPGLVPDVGGATCRFCLHFVDDPAAIEAALPGVAALSSGYGSVRGRDGLCLHHDRFVAASSSCPRFKLRRSR